MKKIEKRTKYLKKEFMEKEFMNRHLSAWKEEIHFCLCDLL